MRVTVAVAIGSPVCLHYSERPTKGPESPTVFRFTGVAAEIYYLFIVHRTYGARRNARFTELLSTDSYAAFATVRFARRLRVVG